MVQARVPQHLPPPIHLASAAAPTLWRGTTVLLIPLIMALIAAIRFQSFNLSVRKHTQHARWALAFIGISILLLIVIRFCAPLFSGWVRVDFTADKVNSLADITHQTAKKVNAPLAAELFITHKNGMPVSMKQTQQAIVGLLE